MSNIAHAERDGISPASDLEMYTPKQAAKIIGIAPETLARWRQQNRGPRFIKSGGYVRYHGAAINMWLRDGGDHA